MKMLTSRFVTQNFSLIWTTNPELRGDLNTQWVTRKRSSYCTRRSHTQETSRPMSLFFKLQGTRITWHSTWGTYIVNFFFVICVSGHQWMCHVRDISQNTGHCLYYKRELQLQDPSSNVTSWMWINMSHYLRNISLLRILTGFFNYAIPTWMNFARCKQDNRKHSEDSWPKHHQTQRKTQATIKAVDKSRWVINISTINFLVQNNPSWRKA